MIRIICIGKIKEKFYRDAIEEYLKRLKKYTKVELIEVPDTKTDNEKIAKRKEKEQIEKYLSSKDYIICLAIEGEESTSIQFANMLEKLQINNSTITFIIGGSCGIDDEIKNKANKLISFSKQTFPHQLFRVMLLEQIYRCYKIINNEAYHK